MVKKNDDNLVWDLILDHIEGDKAILNCGEDSCIVPKSFLPKGKESGGTIQMIFSSKEAEDSKRAKSAKEILNEILNI